MVFNPLHRTTVVKRAKTLSRSWSDRQANYEDNVTIIDSSATSEWAYVLKSWSLGSKTIGGEGFMWIQAVKSTGYWWLSLLAFRGRAFSFWPMTCYTAYCILVVLLVMSVGKEWYFAKARGTWWSSLNSVNNLVGLCLFVMQNSRVSTCYSRWVASSENWAKTQSNMSKLLMMINIGGIESRGSAKAMLRWAIAFLVTAKRSVRSEDDLHELRGLLSKEDAQELEGRSRSTRVMYCWERMQGVIVNCQRMNMFYKTAGEEGMWDTYVSNLLITNLPPPFAMACHTRSFLVLWVMVLPWILMVNLGYVTIAIAILVGYSLLGLDATALELENPLGRDFNDLPIDNWVDNMVQYAFKCYDKAEMLPQLDGDVDDQEGSDGIFKEQGPAGEH